MITSFSWGEKHGPWPSVVINGGGHHGGPGLAPESVPSLRLDSRPINAGGFDAAQGSQDVHRIAALGEHPTLPHATRS